MHKSLLLQLALWAALLGQSGFSHALVAGHFQFVTGDVQVIDSKGLSRRAGKGGEVHEGETLLTGLGASAQLLMIDKGLIALRPDSRLTIENFRFNAQESSNDRSALALVRGAFRAITGLIGRINKSAYVIKTPHATIGIRGTDHETAYVPPPPPGAESLVPPGTYNRVNVGSTFIQTEQGRLELAANQIGFAQLNNAPVRLERTPAVFQTSGTVTPQKPAATNSTTTSGSGSTDSTNTANESDDTASGTTTSGASKTETPATSSTSNTPGTAGNTTPANLPITTTTLAPLNSTSGTCLTCSTNNILGTQAPANTGGVGGMRAIDTSGVLKLDSGAIDNQRGYILRDNNKLPTRITDNTAGDQFIYERNGAADVLSSAGSSTVGSGSNSTWVNWGIYTGGQKADTNSGGAFSPVTHFSWMIAEGGITPATWLQSNLSSFTSGITFSVVGGYTKPVDETGAIGGQVSALNATIAVTGGVPSLTQYNLNVIDAQNRYWAASLNTASIPLTTFIDNPNASGTNTNLSVTRYVSGFTGTVAATGTGQASGFVIGPQSPTGIISSYSMKDTGSNAVMGTVLVK